MTKRHGRSEKAVDMGRAYVTDLLPALDVYRKYFTDLLYTLRILEGAWQSWLATGMLLVGSTVTNLLSKCSFSLLSGR